MKKKLSFRSYSPSLSSATPTQAPEKIVKKSLFRSYLAGINDTQHGETHGNIMRFFIPEFVSAFLLYSLPIWLDAYFISQLASTSAFATLDTTNSLVHFMIKFAEAFSVATIVLSGQFNGKGEYSTAGKVLRDAFWVTVVMGAVFAAFLFFGASSIYSWYGVPDKIAVLGVPFLRLRAVSVLFTFISLAFIGFLRGTKNARAAMYIFITGIIVFVVFDYLLIFGHYGFPKMGLQGSALASTIQYGVMFAFAASYVLYRKKNLKYEVELFSGIGSLAFVGHLFAISWPIVLDKTIMACAYIWLTKMIAPMGKYALASFSIVKNIERFAFLPAIASAQVITYLVSNDYSQKNWQGIKSNIKKVLFLTSIMVIILLLLFVVFPESTISYFDKKGKFTALAAQVLPFLSVLVFFDLIQLILAAALRGASDVKVVMYARLVIILFYFVPFSYYLSHLDIENQVLKLFIIYGAYYLGNGFMGIIYIWRFRGETWKNNIK